MQLLLYAVLWAGLLTASYATDFGPLQVEPAPNAEPVSWIFAHMKLVVIIGGAISAAGVVMIIGLSIVDCLVNNNKVAPVEENFKPKARQGPQSSGGGGRKRNPGVFDAPIPPLAY